MDTDDICGDKGPRSGEDVMYCWRPKGHVSQVHQAHVAYANGRYIPIWTDSTASSAQRFFDLIG